MVWPVGSKALGAADFKSSWAVTNLKIHHQSGRIVQLVFRSDWFFSDTLLINSLFLLLCISVTHLMQAAKRYRIHPHGYWIMCLQGRWTSDITEAVSAVVARDLNNCNNFYCPVSYGTIWNPVISPVLLLNHVPTASSLDLVLKLSAAVSTTHHQWVNSTLVVVTHLLPAP